MTLAGLISFISDLIQADGTVVIQRMLKKVVITHWSILYQFYRSVSKYEHTKTVYLLPYTFELTVTNSGIH